MNKFSDEIQKVTDRIQDLFKEGNLKRIIIRDQNGELFMEVPLYVGIIGTLAAPYVTAIGAIAGYAAKFSIELIKKDNTNSKEVYLLNAYEED